MKGLKGIYIKREGPARAPTPLPTRIPHTHPPGAPPPLLFYPTTSIKHVSEPVSATTHTINNNSNTNGLRLLFGGWGILYIIYRD
jgi:hypothetical protein